MPVHSVPDNSLIFDICKDGNFEAVKKLFERGEEASVFDIDIGGGLHCI
jgi:hypothetical protein